MSAFGPIVCKAERRWSFAEVSSGGRRELSFPHVACSMVSCAHGGHLACALPVTKGQIL